MDERQRQSVTVSAKTVNEAIAEAEQQLGLPRDELDITVINEGSRGFLGMGAENARILAVPKAVLAGGTAAAAPPSAPTQTPAPPPPRLRRTTPAATTAPAARTSPPRDEAPTAEQTRPAQAPLGEEDETAAALRGEFDDE